MIDNPNFREYFGRTLVDNARLWSALNKNKPDFEEIKSLVRKSYEEETGRVGADVAEIAIWLQRAERSNPRFEGLCVERPIIRWVMFPGLADKFWSLMQRKCQLCNLYERSQMMMFMLHTRPISRQVGLHAAFKEAVSAYLTNVAHDFTSYFDSRLCVAITFILPVNRILPDVDNMAKTLLDALEGHAYRDDKQIDHLDLLRFNSGNEDSFITVRLAATQIASNLDVLRPEFDVRWAGEGMGGVDIEP